MEGCCADAAEAGVESGEVGDEATGVGSFEEKKSHAESFRVGNSCSAGVGLG